MKSFKWEDIKINYIENKWNLGRETKIMTTNCLIVSGVAAVVRREGDKGLTVR